MSEFYQNLSFVTIILILMTLNAIVLGTDKKRADPVPIRDRNSPTYHCNDLEGVEREDDNYKQCFTEKWLPLPTGQDPTNLRECCRNFDRFCVYDKLTRNKCKIISEDGFQRQVNKKYADEVDFCANSGVKVSIDICKQEKTNPPVPLALQYCSQFINCNPNETTITPTKPSGQLTQSEITAPEGAAQDGTTFPTETTTSLSPSVYSFKELSILLLIISQFVSNAFV